MKFDLLIHNGSIITVNPNFDILDNGWIGINGTRIESIGEMKSGEKLPDAVETIDARRGIIMPGIINTHSHLPMTLFRGLADDLPLATWLNEHIFPAEQRMINPDTVYDGALLGCAEMILSGTTTCCDGYFLEDNVASAILKSGIRAIAGQGVIDYPAPGVPDPANRIEHAKNFCEKWIGFSPLIQPSVFCHSPYTCSGKTLQEAKRVAASKDLLFQIHIAETRSEKQRIQLDHQKSPIAYLDNLNILDHRTLLVHSIWVDDDDIEIILKRNAAVSVTTESEMKLSSGIAPIPRFIEAGIRLGLGTDGCASNNNLDMFQEMDMTAKIHKVHSLNPTITDAQTVLRLATIGGAQAIGLDARVGSLEVGKDADMIVLDTRSPHLIPMYHPISHLVYCAKGSDVRDTIVAGKILMRDRVILSMDIEEVMDRVRVCAGMEKG